MRLLYAGVLSIALHATAMVFVWPLVAPSDGAAVRDKPLQARIVTVPPKEPEAPDDLLKDTLRETPPARGGRAAREVARSDPVARQAPKRSAPETGQAEVLSQAELQRTLERVSETLFYPPEAVARGLEGEVILAIEVDAAGRIVAASVAAGSGHALLDDAALRAVARIGRLPAVAGRTILLPVRFSLL